MNFLAHLFIAERRGADAAGAMLGDVVTGSDLGGLPDDVAVSIRLHRRVDAAFDGHAATRSALAELPAGERRWGRITLDLYADHWLARHWEQWHDEPLATFSRRMAETVAARGDAFAACALAPPDPSRLARILFSVAEPAGIETAIARIADRARRAEAVRVGCSNWQQHGVQLAPRMPEVLRDCLRA